MPAGTQVGPLGLHRTITQGTVSIRLIDKRRALQAYADAEDFNAVRFKLSNPAKLKNARITGKAASAGTYEAVFAGLPSDGDERYTLTVELYKNVTDLKDLEAPDYESMENKVGEGVKTFSLQAGENALITVVINAVGEFEFASSTSTIDPDEPVFKLGDASAEVRIVLSSETNPEATAVRYAVVDPDDVLLDERTKLVASWQAPPTPTSLPFTLPESPGTYRFVVEMLKGETVLSHRERLFEVVMGGISSTPVRSVTVPTNVLAAFADKDSKKIYYLFNEVGYTNIKDDSGATLGEDNILTEIQGGLAAVRRSNGDFIIGGGFTNLRVIPNGGDPSIG